MPELHPSEEEAALYLLGELSEAENAAFEERLEQSAELRALVRDLEEGATAFAISCPRHLPRPQTWQRIERAVRRESRRVVVPVFLGGWWRNGWVAAAACLIGWMLYAFWMHRSTSSNAGVHLAIDRSAPGLVSIDPPPTEQERSKPLFSSTPSNQREELLEIRLRENAALRSRVRDLENQVTQLSQSLTQHQALLGESGRLKFVQLLPPGNRDGTTVAPHVSPDLQRALFLAMARELGWLENGEPRSNASTNKAGVSFVDLRASTNKVANPPEVQSTEPATETANANPPAPPSNGATSGGTIPGFVSASGDSMVLAVDSSIAPTGSTLTFWTGAVGQGQLALGTLILGENPTAVTLPFASPYAGGRMVTVTMGTAGGGSVVIGQLSTAGLHP